MRYSKRMPFEERLALIRRGPDDCWIWPWAATPRGYGKVCVDGKYLYAHRLAYELLVAPIPKHHELDHFKCDTPSCCNPAHTRPTRRKQHRHRHVDARTHCVHGHPLLPVTPTTWRQNPNGTRICNECYKVRLALRHDPAGSEAYRVNRRLS